MTDWQPRDAVAQLAEQNGWNVRRIKIDDGCYEVKGTDANGHKFEVKVHPGTLAIVEHEYEDDDDDCADPIRGGSAAAPNGQSTPPQNGLFTPGKAPSLRSN